MLNSLRTRISKDNDEQDLPDSELTDLLKLFDRFIVMSFWDNFFLNKIFQNQLTNFSKFWQKSKVIFLAIQILD